MWYESYRKRLLFGAFDSKRKGYVTAIDILDGVVRLGLVKTRKEFVSRLGEAGITKTMRLKFRAFVNFAEKHIAPDLSKREREKVTEFWQQVSLRAGDVQLSLQSVDQDKGILRFCMGPSRRSFVIKYPISQTFKSGTSSQLSFEAFESESMRKICNEINEFLRHRTYSTREGALVVALEEITAQYV